MDPIKEAVLRAIFSFHVRVGGVRRFGWDMADALAQKSVCFMHFYLLEVEVEHY
jgi:hypothetical protein